VILSGVWLFVFISIFIFQSHWFFNGIPGRDFYKIQIRLASGSDSFLKTYDTMWFLGTATITLWRDSLYIIGGHHEDYGEVWSHNVKVLNLETRTWNDLPRPFF
jgi:hypothetical protein